MKYYFICCCKYKKIERNVFYLKMLSVAELTNEIERLGREGETRLKTPEYENIYRKKSKAQIDYELEKLSADRLCHAGDKTAFSFLEGLNKEQIRTKLETEFYNHGVMEAFRCSINVILDSSDGEESTRERMHEFIGEISRFGAESVNGFALKTSLGDVNNHIKKAFDMFVMKCPRSFFKSHEMVHEIMIGLEGLNEVRKKCPTFSYVYDSFKDGAPITDKDKNVVEWGLPGSAPVSYALYENIANAIPINDVENAEDFLLDYMQCVLALIIAHKLCDFTHYDAHGENVLLKFVSDEPFYIGFDVDGIITYLRSSGRIASFIDYGMSHIKTRDGRHIGILDTDGFFDSCSIKSDESNVISDAYKLVCMVMTMSDKQDVKDMCMLILGYFFGKHVISEDEAKIITTRQWPARYHVPKELTSNWSLEGLFEYCKVMALEFNHKNVLYIKPGNVLGNGYMPTLREEIKLVSTFTVEVPSAFEVYGSKGKVEHEKMVNSLKNNPKAVLIKETSELAKYLDFEYDDVYYALPTQEAKIKASLSVLTENIAHIAHLVEILYEMTQEIKYLEYCDSICPDVFNKLIAKMKSKKAKIVKSLFVKRASIKTASERLDNMVFGFSGRQPTESETEQASKHLFYSLCDTYKNVSNSLIAMLIRK